MRILLFVAVAFVLFPKLWHVGDTDRDAVRQEVRAWSAEHQTEIQDVVREVMLARSQFGALAPAAETTDAGRVEDARETRRSYWQ